MKDNKIVRFRQAVTSGHAPIYILAAVGAVFIPVNWVLPLLVTSVCMQLLFSGRKTPAELRDYWREPEVVRTLVCGGVIWLWAMLRYSATTMFVDYRWFDSHYGRFNLLAGAEAAMLGTALVYLAAVCCAQKGFPKERTGREYDLKLQRWTNASFSLFTFCSLFLLALVCLAPNAPVDQISHWLMSSLADANIFQTDEFRVSFSQVIGVGAFAATSALLWSRVVRISAFFTALAKQNVLTPATKFGEPLVQVFRAPRTVLKLREPHPFLKNMCSSFWYIGIIYLVLLWLFGFTTGPFGATISNWLLSCVERADAIPAMHFMGSADSLPPTNQQLDNLRVFCASIVALYSTVPAAIMTSVFLPYARRREMHLTDDGILFPDAVTVGGRLRQMVLWTDVAEVDLKRGKKAKRGNLTFRFHSGGKLVLREAQLDSSSLDKLLGALDEHAQNCIVSDAVVALRSEIRAKIAVDAKQHEVGAMSAQNFQSTIFVPHDRGAWLPNGEARVVRLLASRPLSCVYLVRLNSGELAIAKQFFLADDNEQAKALRKTFQREYELLKQIEHPKIAKILDVFERDESTYLLIEHAAGMDLRKMVEEEGPQPEVVVIDWALQICDIVESLHAQDPPIVHRDLTPDNLILGADGSVRIIDFGAAHQFMEGVTGTIIGKQCFVPPEQLRGQAGPASDVYAFGCTLHYLLTGEEPKALTQCVPKAKENVSEELDNLVQRCTEFDETLRPQSFSEVRSMLLATKEARDPDVVVRRFFDTVIKLSEAEKVGR